MKEKIIFFGGTFDPPHCEHIALAIACERKYSPDKFIVMPTCEPPHKESVYPADADDRFNMCLIAFSKIKNLEVSDYEIKKGGKSYSFQTIAYLREKYPDAEIIFPMGTDMLSTFYKWKNPRFLLDNCKLCLCTRGTDESAEQTLANFRTHFDAEVDVLDFEGTKLSSTEYKISAMLGLDVSEMTDRSVQSYIEEHSLYLPDKYFKFVKEHLKYSRLLHTKGVILKAVEIAKDLGEDLHKTVISAVLHDCAKYEKAENYPLFSPPTDVPESVMHQYLGGYIAKNVLGVTDPDVIEAITYHTSGKENMKTLSKIIYVADMIEQGRDYSGVEELRKAVKSDFNEGFYLCLKRSVEFLKASNKPIYGKTLVALEYYKREISNEF